MTRKTRRSLLRNAGPFDPRQTTRVRPSDRGFYVVTVNHYLGVSARMFTRRRAKWFASQVENEWRIKFLNPQEDMGDYYKDHWWPSHHLKTEYRGLVAESGCRLDEAGAVVTEMGVVLE